MFKLNYLYFAIIPSLFFINYSFAVQPTLAVVEENAGYVSFYEKAHEKKIASVKVGFLPHEIAIASDQKTAYVSNFGIRDYDSGSGIPGASISVIDIPTFSEKYRLYTFDSSEHKDYSQLDSAVHGLKIRPKHENQLYVNVEKGSKVIIFDVTTRKIIKRISVNPNTHNLFFSPDGNILWLMAAKDGVLRLDAETGEVTGTYFSSTPVRGLKYTPDNRYLMVSAVNQVSLIDPDTLEVKKQFTNLGVGPILYSDMTPDQKYIIAPAAFDNQIVVIEVATGNVIKRFITGLNPINVLIDEEGRYAYISNATDKHVSKLDLQTFKITTIQTNEGPNGLAFLLTTPKGAHKKLILGVPLPLSGIESASGRDMMRGYEYWRLSTEQAGGLFINNEVYDVKIIYADTQSDTGKIAKLTQDLISTSHVTILLSTPGLIGYNLEKQIALANQVAITPAQLNNTWLPDDIAAGFDNFITTKSYDQNYYVQYNFKASGYSAAATSIGIFMQKALNEAKDLNYLSITNAFNQGKYNLFYQF